MSLAVRFAVVLALAAYWLAMAYGTHMNSDVAFELETAVPDKLQHYAAYAGLAFLMASCRACYVPVTPRALCGLLAIAAGYGVVDELTQLLVGRDASVEDWVADVIGGCTGLAVFYVAGFVARLLRARRGVRQGSVRI